MSTKRSVDRLAVAREKDRSAATQENDRFAVTHKVDRCAVTHKKDRSGLCAFTFPREPSIRKPFTIDTSKLTKFQAYNYL